MKKSRDKDKKRSKSDGGDSRDDDMKKMKEKWKRQQARKEGGNDSDSTWLKLKVGRNKIRVLPRPGTGQFYLEVPKHFRVGPDQVGVRCIDPNSIDEKNGRPKPSTKCPVCKEFIRKQRAINNKYERGSERGSKLWSKAFKKYAPNQQCLMNAIDADGSVKKFAAGPMIMEQLLSYFFDDEGEVGDFTAIDTGRSISVKRAGQGRRTKYTCRVLDPSSEDDISDRWDELQEQLHDLNEAGGEILSVEDVKAIMEGDGEDGEDAADTGSDDDDDDGAEESADDASDGDDDSDGYPDDDESGDDDSDDDASDDDDDDDDDGGSHRSRRSRSKR